MRLFVLYTVALYSLAACSKRSDAANNDLYLGTWELRNTVAMLGPTDYPPGTGIMLRFTKDSAFTYFNNRLSSSDAYRMSRERAFFFVPPRIMDKVSLLTNGEMTTFFYLELRKDTLVQYVGAPAADGGSASFVRVN